MTERFSLSKLRSGVAFAALGLALTACTEQQTATEAPAEPKETAAQAGPGKQASFDRSTFYYDSARIAEKEGDFDTAANYWAQAYALDSSDVGAAVRFARTKRYAGAPNQVVDGVLRILPSHPNNAELRSELGKSLIAIGKADAAIEHLMAATKAGGGKWSDYSALGVAYDRTGKHDLANEAYVNAFKRSPNNPVVLNNHALSRAMAGDLDTAIALIDQATRVPGANIQIRQNKAMILGMAGKFSEAQEIAAIDLPSDMAEKNVEFYRQMLSQTNRWGLIQ